MLKVPRYCSNHFKNNRGRKVVDHVMLSLLTLAISTVMLPPKVGQSSGDTAGFVQCSEACTLKETLREKPKSNFAIVKNPAFLLLRRGLALTYLGLFSPLFYLHNYAQAICQSEDILLYMVSIVSAASLVGGILPGHLANRYRHFNMLTSAAFLSGIIAFRWTAAKNISGLVAWVLAYGITSGVRKRLFCGGLMVTG